MKKRILALVLALATLAGVLPLVASAVPYAPSANAWKDFGQQHLYLYEVTKGKAAPKMDGYVTDADGYGEPVATYGFRYKTTADYVTPDVDGPEFKLCPNGDYYVYPTENSTQEVWDTIQSMETDSPYGYIWTVKVSSSSFSATASYYYKNPYTLSFSRAYHVTKETIKDYDVLDQQGSYVLRNATALKEKPEDWEKNFASYYQKLPGRSNYDPVQATEDGKAPEFKASAFYSGDRIHVDTLYQSAEGSPGAIAYVAELKRHHVLLPEKINLYARYNDSYLYYAIEVVENKHVGCQYRSTYYFGTNMSNVPSIMSNAYDYNGSVYKQADGKSDAVMELSGLIRTNINTSTSVKSTLPILRKYGNLEATSIKQVTQLGTDYNVTHTPYQPKAPAQTENTDDFMSDGMEEEEDLTSGSYGTTVYEYRLPWKVINGQYNPATSTTAVPEMFTLRGQVQLENSLANGHYFFMFNMPRETHYLPGSNARSGANYPDDLFMMRYPHRTGLTTGENYGTYNFMWACVSSSYGNWDPYVTDLANITNRKTASASHVGYTYFTAGQEPAEGYVQPYYVGANIRADGAENQKMRIQFAIPQTDKEIEEAGVIVAPTEVARRNQLKLGMSSIAYYAEDRPVLYGVEEDGTWINMSTEADKYFAATATPNDSDSFAAQDVYGGKPSGIYTVYTLPTNLENVSQHTDPETGAVLGDMYSVVFGGANGEGLYHDFDDFFTFYTIRPYIIYKDGTVTYGEHEYKSIYYIACWLIQDMLSNYNEQVTGTTAIAEQYNMDEMYLASVTGPDGKTLKDTEGNTLYLPVGNTSASYSPYAGGAERSIYLPEPRAQIFRWFAVRTINRANQTSLRWEYYDDFSDDVKVLVEQYVQMYENIWNIIVQCENTRYVEMR